MFAASHSSAVETPSPQVLPIVAGAIGAAALIGFILGLQAGAPSGGGGIGGTASTDPAILAGAPNATPVILNPVETAPPPPPPVEEPEEVVEAAPPPIAIEPPPPIALPPPPVAAPAPVEPPPAAAAAIY